MHCSRTLSRAHPDGVSEKGLQRQLDHCNLMLQGMAYKELSELSSMLDIILAAARLVAERLGGPDVTHASFSRLPRDSILRNLGGFSQGVCR